MDVLVKIENDVFDIASRVKEIDSDYFVVYNRTKRRFEIHNKKQKPTLALVVPHNELDCRTIEYVLKTKISRIDEIVREIDAHNEKIEKQKFESSIERLSYKTKNLIGYLDKGKSYLPSYEEI